MLILTVHHHKTYIENATENDLELVREALTVFKKKYRLNQYQEWEVTYILSTKDFSFPTAYLDEVLVLAEEKNIKVDITDQRKYPAQQIPKLMLRKELSLREEQKNALAMIRENSTGIIMMPTASGKSRVIAHCINEKKVKTLIVVPRTNLQNEMASFLREYFGPSRAEMRMPHELKQMLEHGKIRLREDDPYLENHALRKEPRFKLDESLLIEKKPTEKKSFFDEIVTKGPGKLKYTLDLDALGEKKEEINPEQAFLKDKKQKKWDKQKEWQKKRWEKGQNKEIKVRYRDIYVICDASLENLPQVFLDQFQMVIVDECHHSAGKMIRSCLLRLKNAAYRYYFSATPWRDHPAEDQILASAIGTKIIFELSPEDAIKYNNIAKPELIWTHSPEPKNFMKDKKKWREILEFGIIGNDTRNKKIVADAIEDFQSGRNVFIAVDEISHLEILKQRIEAAGIEVDIIHGELSSKTNYATIKAVGARTEGICIGTMSVGEGTDMPNLDCVIMASGGKSSIRFLQRIGRGARKGTSQDKISFIVRDYFDWFHPTLLRHSLRRKNIFEDYFKEFK